MSWCTSCRAKVDKPRWQTRCPRCGGPIRSKKPGWLIRLAIRIGVLASDAESEALGKLEEFRQRVREGEGS